VQAGFNVDDDRAPLLDLIQPTHSGLDEQLYGERGTALYTEAADEIERLRAALTAADRYIMEDMAENSPRSDGKDVKILALIIFCLSRSATI
jgi:hypothetical protein